jgi:hypothetical protein
MQTLYLDTDTWDLTIDASRNIAVASIPYALAQDAASAIRTFLKEVYYDTTKGVDYWGLILGKSPSLQVLKAQLSNAALTVPGVVWAQVYISSIVERRVAGQVQVTDSSGTISVASF